MGNKPSSSGSPVQAITRRDLWRLIPRCSVDGVLFVFAVSMLVNVIVFHFLYMKVRQRWSQANKIVKSPDEETGATAKGNLMWTTK